MPRLIACPSCHVHVLVQEGECPHCGVALRVGGPPRVAAIAVGLTLASCIVAEPAYGIPDPTATSTGTEGETTTATDTGSTDGMTGSGSQGTGGTGDTDGTGTADSGSDGTAGSSGPSGTDAPEPPYGVPTSG